MGSTPWEASITPAATARPGSASSTTSAWPSRSLRKKGLRRMLYVDIDVHHGDGRLLPLSNTTESVFIFDVHEDGRFLYPGTGRENGDGRGRRDRDEGQRPPPSRRGRREDRRTSCLGLKNLRPVPSRSSSSCSAAPTGWLATPLEGRMYLGVIPLEGRRGSA